MIQARVPKDRLAEGTVEILDAAGSVIAGPFECRAKADNAGAAQHGNPTRDPLRPFGDHPSGSYVVQAIEHGKSPAHTYGPVFMLLDPTDGDALQARRNGRTGLAIHGGDPSATMMLRPTFGCLRVSNAAIVEMARHIRVGDVYVCEDA
jgi:L,D-transpeptidase-like protein